LVEILLALSDTTLAERTATDAIDELDSIYRRSAIDQYARVVTPLS
jgi:hypothetical protein